MYLENRGQLGNDEVLYYSTSGAFGIGFGLDCVLLNLVDAPRRPSGASPDVDALGMEARRLGGSDDGRGARGCMLRLGFVGARQVEPKGCNPVPWSSNFFIGDDDGRWRTGVPGYRQVKYEGLWDGIDLIYGSSLGQPKYEFIVHPHADPGAIWMSVEGSEALEMGGGGGDLVLRTPSGAEVHDGGLLAYYGDGSETPVGATFTLRGRSTFGFDVGPYDTSRTLVIDPLVYSTYIGGSGDDYCSDVEMDAEGNAYITGSTYSTDFPTTAGAYCTTCSSGQLFVVKLARDGVAPVFSTFVGGSNGAGGDSLVLDGSGDIYVTGLTSSKDFPATTTRYRKDTLIGGVCDAVVLKLASNGSSLLYSIPFGGDGTEKGYGIDVDDDGHAYVTGYTGARDFVTTDGAYDTTNSSFWTRDIMDIFVIKVAANGTSLEYSARIGGHWDDYGRGIAVDGMGRAHVAGHTYSADLPTTAGAYCRTLHGSRHDVVALSLSADGSALVYSTYVGGANADDAYAMALDGDGCLYMTGETFSDDYPISPGGINRSGCAAFITKLSADGSSLVYSSKISGGYATNGYDIALDGQRNAYVTGRTYGGYPTTEDAYDRTYNGGFTYAGSYGDVFVLKLSVNGSTILYSTYFGSDDMEQGQGIAVGRTGNICVVGVTIDGTLPTTPAAFDTVLDGYRDGFAFLLDISPPTLVNDSTPGNATTGDPFTFNATVTDGDGVGNVTVVHWRGDRSRRAEECATLVSGDGRNGTWALNVTMPSDSIEVLHYYLHIEDLSGNFVNTSVRNVTVIDNDLPAIDDVTAGNGTTGDELTMTVEVEDNIGIQEVHINHWFGTNRSGAKNSTMTGASVSGIGNGSYTYTLRVPAQTIEPISYFFAVNDTSGNWNASATGVRAVSDDDLPEVEEPRLPGATTGDPYEFLVNATDNIGVARVQVLYWYGADMTSFWDVDMSAEEPTGIGNGTYSLDIVVRGNSTARLSHYFIVTDTSGNRNVTRQAAVAVIDNDPPTLDGWSNTSGASTGSTVGFSVVVADNIAVSPTDVHVVFWFGDRQSEALNITMQWAWPADGPEDLWMEGCSVPTNSLEPIHFYFAAKDVSGNWNTTRVMAVGIHDGTLPAMRDVSDTGATTGDPFTLMVEVSDNFGISSVKVSYFFDIPSRDEYRMDPVQTTGGGNGTYALTVHVPGRATSPLSYHFIIMDSSGNVANGPVVMVQVNDNDPPALEVHAFSGKIIKGRSSSRILTIQDNIESSHEAYVEYWLDDGLHSNETLDAIGGPYSCYATWTINVSRHAPGALHYFFTARDGAGNWNSTGLQSEVPANAPPVLTEPPPFIVFEDVAERVDLRKCMQDANDPLDNLTLQSLSSNLTIIGFNFTFLFTNPFWDTTLSVPFSISDGEDTTLANVTIQVRVRDDPPIIKWVQPINGTSFREGEPVPLRAMATDEEGNALIYKWSEGASMLGTGQSLNLTGLAAGHHLVRLRVSDTNSLVEWYVEFDVQKEGKAASMGWWLLLLCLAATMLVVIALVLLGRRRRRSVAADGGSTFADPSQKA